QQDDEQNEPARCGDVFAVREGLRGVRGRALRHRLPRCASRRQRGHPAETEWYPRQDSNLRTWLRRPVLYPLSYGGGVGTPPILRDETQGSPGAGNPPGEPRCARNGGAPTTAE